jgi:hypothetical protein
MLQLGYLKDFLALFFFSLGIFKIYNINDKNLIIIKNELLIYLIIAFITDLSFTLYPKFHYTYIGYNSFTFFFITMIILVLINFIYFNIHLLF